MTMLLNRKEPVNGVDSKLAKSIAQSCSGEWQTPPQIARQVGYGEARVASALPFLAEAGFVVEREGLWSSDRGCHYRWPGWISICNENGLVRSTSRKGCSPDNARCEGYFGRLKIEFFFGCDWTGVTIEEFMGMLDAYLGWYRDVRIKSDLDYRSPMQYRRDLGLAA